MNPIMNPFDLVPITINDIETNARPIEFSSDIINFETLTDKNGKNVYPTKIATTCPSCGNGLEYIIDETRPIKHNCYMCNNIILVPPHPFMEPISADRIEAVSLDHLVVAGTLENIDIPTTTTPANINQELINMLDLSNVISDKIEHRKTKKKKK